MTNREAIEILIRIARQVDDENLSVYTEEETEALCMAIQALEKQEPKKPVKDNRGYYEIETCPSCGNDDLWSEEMGYELAYCLWCGQALKWEE